MIQSAFGMLAFAAFAWAVSENRRRVRLRLVAGGMLLQLVIGWVLLKSSLAREGFLLLNHLALSLEKSTRAGTAFVFGYLGGGELPFVEQAPGASFILAFQALPLILVISALSSLLFYWKILPWIVRGFSWFLQKTMALGGAEGLGVSANVFVGMVEAPLFVRPYLQSMTRSELFTLMTTGMATIAGTVMVLYASILQNSIPDIMGHILTASIISVPAAVTVAKIMVPETETVTAGKMVPPEPANSAMDAVTKGTVQGVSLLLNIVAMLIVLVALVHLVNLVLGWLPDIGGKGVTLERIFGAVMAPVVWLMGIPWSEAHTAGSIMGVKTILNEFLAYLQLSQTGAGMLSDHSRLILTYALCGFANPGSLGIMIGGMGTMAPDRRDEIVSMGLRSILSGTLATCMTGAVVGMVV
jgi:CNT family concentrative nucleoside transporter